MKKTIFLLIACFISSAIHLPNQTENQSTQVPSTTFKVCNVTKANGLLIPNSFENVIIEKTVTKRNQEEREEAILKKTDLNYLEKNKLLSDSNYQPDGVPVRIIEDFDDSKETIIPTHFHSFVNTVHDAYSMHYPLTISPDMVWLMIAQGFATHINQNAEEMRSYFVDFNGKKNLDIQRDSFLKGGRENDWEGAFSEWSQKIEENTGPEMLKLVSGKFSTTTTVEQAAFEITLMDAMKSYFTYSMTTSCGIPEITLEGEVEDWRLIEEKAQALAKYELDWWIDRLMPVLKEFTNAAEGNVNTEFWESIYKWNSVGSGNPYITGWILNFFPYLDVHGKIQKNSRVANERPYGMIETDMFTSGLSKADFVWNYLEVFFKMELLAGFVGYQQDPETLSLRPVISWSVVDTQEKASSAEIKNYYNGGDEEYLKSRKKN